MANSPYPGGKPALFLFVLVQATTVVQSQLTQVSSTRQTGLCVPDLIPATLVSNAQVPAGGGVEDTINCYEHGGRQLYSFTRCVHHEGIPSGLAHFVP